MSLTLDDLLAELQHLKDTGVHGDTPVRLSYDYGDHSHTTCCPEVDSVVQAFTKHNSYINEHSPVDEEDDLELLEAFPEGTKGEEPHPQSCVVLCALDVNPWR